MFHRWRGLLFCAIGAIAIALLLAVAPGQSSDPGGPGGAVTFSAPSGFYDAPFWLELDGDGGTVYYTLDASDPDEHSIPYTGPILIGDATPNANVYSMIADTTVYMRPDLLEKNGVESHWKFQAPVLPVDKATVIRAVSIDGSGHPGATSEAVFFVGYEGREGFDGCYIMTITTDPENLFGDEKGIYVLGKTFADATVDGVVRDKDLPVFKWKSNFNQKGMDWEREASIQCFSPDRKLVLSGNYGIRIQGNSTRSMLPKNLNLYGRKAYSSPGIDAQALFGRPMTLNRLQLCYGHNKTMLKDYLVRQTAGDRAFAIRDYVPCALFLDGEYWGTYWLTERFKKDFISQLYGVEPESIVAIKNGMLEIGIEGDADLYRDTVAFIADHDMSLPENYEHACEMIDVESCLDYLAEEIYLANIDWPDNNQALWRSRKAGGGPYADGRWRWLMYDMDASMQPENAAFDGVQKAANGDDLFAGLMENEGFASALRARLVALAEETYDPDAMDAFIDDFKASMAGAIRKKYERFYAGEKTLEQLYRECDDVKQFFRARRDYIINNYGGKDQ